jgi:hypothetical protein
MFARVSRFEGSPEGMDEALRHVREHVLPQLQSQDGSKGLIALGDRQSGTVLGVTLGRVKKRCAPASKKQIGCVRSQRKPVTKR